MDIPESLLIVDMDKLLHMVLRGRLSELMAQLTPSGSHSTKHIQVHYFFNQVSYCGLGQNFGTLPNGKDTWISLHKTSVGIVLQEITRIDTRDTR